MTPTATFRQHILKHEVLDTDGIHHEFVYGAHGKKLDFDLITDNSPLYLEWVKICADFIQSNYPKLPDAVLGVANGTNRLARDVAASLGITPLYTQKLSPKEVVLTDESKKQIITNQLSFIIVLEDVGTTGGTAHKAAMGALEAGASETPVLFTWKRRDKFEAFEGSDILYDAIIDEVLPTYNPEECAESGYCSKGWELIPHIK